MNLSAVLTGISLLAFTIAEDVIPPSDTCTGPVETLTIGKITGKIDNKLEVCCKEIMQIIDAPAFLLIITKSDGVLWPLDSTINTLGCVEFGIDITSLAAPGDVIKIAMQLLDNNECPIAVGEVEITYPTLPAVTEFFATDPVVTNNEILLLQGEMNGFSFSNLGSIQHISSLDERINYYFGKLPATVQLCITLTPINFCDVPLSLKASALVKGPSVTSSVLSYGYINTVDVPVTVTMETSSNIATDGSDVLDILYMSDTDDDKVVYRGDLTGSCEILWSNPSSNTATFRLIGLNGNTPKETDIHEIPDRELLIGEINPGIVEARWLMLMGDAKTYHLRLNKVTPPSDLVLELNVDCSQVSLTNCFGYFSGLLADTYTITVQTRTSETDYDEVKRIQSPAITTTINVFKELHIQDVHISGHLGHKAVLLGVCFNHATYDVDQIFSHYEFVLINEKGQWLKHYLMITETDGDLCFSPYTINPMAFDISQGTTLVVTQRAENGFDVLASARTHVNFGTIL